MNTFRMWRGAALVAGLLAALPLGAHAAAPPFQAAAINPSATHFHDAYYMLQHNTYDYGSTLTSWLDQGFRSLELDVIDKEDWENDANGPYVSHDSGSGNKNCSGNPDRLGHCLGDVSAWLAAHPSEGPVLVFIDMKASWDPASAWNDDEVAMLDDKVRSILGSRIYTGGDLYQYATGAAYTGSGKSLRQAVSEQGWPLLASMQGKVVVAYTGGKIGLANQTQGNGIAVIAAQSPKRLPYGFFCPDVEGDPNELNPGGTTDGISNAISQYLVCSNMAAIDNGQVTMNRAAQHHQILHIWGEHVYSTDSFVYNYVAMAHGVSAVGRDSNPGDTFGGAIPPVGVRRSLPGYFELRPQSNPSMCMDVSGSGGSNGTAIVLKACAGTSNQRFVYTAEGQLRPQHAGTSCADIKGGSAGSGKNIHLWDCDGGNSEKWLIASDGSFKSYDGQSYCLEAGGSSGAQFVTRTCSGGIAQKFNLNQVSDWVQTSF